MLRPPRKALLSPGESPEKDMISSHLAPDALQPVLMGTAGHTTPGLLGAVGRVLILSTSASWSLSLGSRLRGPGEGPQRKEATITYSPWTRTQFCLLNHTGKLFLLVATARKGDGSTHGSSCLSSPTSNSVGGKLEASAHSRAHPAEPAQRSSRCVH